MISSWIEENTNFIFIKISDNTISLHSTCFTAQGTVFIVTPRCRPPTKILKGAVRNLSHTTEEVVSFRSRNYYHYTHKMKNMSYSSIHLTKVEHFFTINIFTDNPIFFTLHNIFMIYSIQANSIIRHFPYYAYIK